MSNEIQKRNSDTYNMTPFNFFEDFSRNLFNDFKPNLIKTDIHDFRRDFKKKRYHDCKNVKYLYYAMPRSLYEENRNEINFFLKDAGLILIDEIDTDDFRGNIYEFGGFVRRAKARDDWYELSPTGLMHYLRIGCMKWVNR